MKSNLELAATRSYFCQAGAFLTICYNEEQSLEVCLLLSDEFVSSFYPHLIRLGNVAVQIVWHKMIQYPKNIDTCLTKNGGLLILLVLYKS